MSVLPVAPLPSGCTSSHHDGQEAADVFVAANLSVEAEEAARQAELEEELRRLEEEIRQLGGECGLNASCIDDTGSGIRENVVTSNIEYTWRETTTCGCDFSCNSTSSELEDLPVERLCLFLPAAALAALRTTGGPVASRIAELLERLLERHTCEAAGPGRPLLLPLLHLLHAVQVPHIAVSQLSPQDEEAFGGGATGAAASLPRSTSSRSKMPRCRAGHAVVRQPASWAGPPGAERWCPFVAKGGTLPRGGACVEDAYTCTWNLGKHFTPRLLRLELYCEGSTELLTGHGDGSLHERWGGPPPFQVSISLVDTSVPKQPLFSLTLDGPMPDIHEEIFDSPHHVPGNHSAHHGGNASAWLRAAVREVVSCQGRGAWAYRQRTWPLGPAGASPTSAVQDFAHSSMSSANGKSLTNPSNADKIAGEDEDPRWVQLHIEFDWEAALCAAIVDGRIEGPLQLDWRPEFGFEPTVDALRLQLAPNTSVSLTELLVG